MVDKNSLDLLFVHNHGHLLIVHSHGGFGWHDHGDHVHTRGGHHDGRHDHNHGGHHGGGHDHNHDGHCDLCGSCQCIRRVPVAKPIMKEVKETCIHAKCEDVIIPGPACLCGKKHGN